MKELSDSPGCCYMSWRSVSLPGREQPLSKLDVNWWHTTCQEVSIPSDRFISDDCDVPVGATGK
jgi:hypothetical protein